MHILWGCDVQVNTTIFYDRDNKNNKITSVFLPFVTFSQSRIISLPPATVHEQSLSLQITRSDMASGTEQRHVTVIHLVGRDSTYWPLTSRPQHTMKVHSLNIQLCWREMRTVSDITATTHKQISASPCTIKTCEVFSLMDQTRELHPSICTSCIQNSLTVQSI